MLHQQLAPIQSPSRMSSLSSDKITHPTSSDFQIKLKVLIVDDNLLNLRVMKQLLKKKLERFLDLDALQTASSGLGALDLLSSHSFDIVFLDISMPDISGLEVCRRLRTSSDFSHPQPHVCAVTTDLADWQIQHYRSFGMDGVIGKPLKDSDLQFALESCSQSSMDTHICSQSNPHFYFRRHGSHQPLPPLLPIPIDSLDVSDQSDSWHSLSTVTLTTPPHCPICQTDSRSDSASYNDLKSRHQSIVSESNVSTILSYQDSETVHQIPRPRLQQLNLSNKPWYRERSSSFESCDTSTPGSMTTCSSGPSSVIANDMLSPLCPPASIDMPQLSPSQRFAAFPTAPIMTSTAVTPSLPRVHFQRRWDSFSCSFAFNPRAFRFAKHEKDVFADGFGAAMNSTQSGMVYLGHHSGNTDSPSRRRSHDDLPVRDMDYGTYFSKNDEFASPNESRSNNFGSQKSSKISGPVRKNGDEKWTQLAQRKAVTQSNPISKISAVTRQLITRRSHPVLRTNRCEAQEISTAYSNLYDDGESIPMRKTLSASGLLTRPSWQLVQLSTLNCQSILKSGGLLDEVLTTLDLEDHNQ